MNERADRLARIAASHPTKNCVRCGAEVFGLPQHQPHLCADIVKRLARRERQRDAVVELLDEAFQIGNPNLVRNVAEDIVAKLANMGVEND